MRIHLDTDLGGDTDDACALAMLLGWPGVELVGTHMHAWIAVIVLIFATVGLVVAGVMGFMRRAID